MIINNDRKGGFISATKRWIKGIFSFSHVTPIIPPNLTVGTLSIINDNPVGTNSLMQSTQGTASVMTSSVGSLSIVNDNSVGTNSLITPTQGTDSEL